MGQDESKIAPRSPAPSKNDGAVCPTPSKDLSVGPGCIDRASARATFEDPFAAVSDKSHETKPFVKKLNELYPGAMNHEEAAVAIKHVLRQHGFTAHGSIALVAQCRDEITKPFCTAIDHNWMGSFNISSLAGTVFTGRTGFGAALHHAPQDEEGLERYVIFCGPHIAIDKDGQVGKVVRRGRASLSTACGALIAFEAELKSGRVNTNDKPLDVEYCNLKRRLLAGIDFGKPAPGLAGLTGVCQETTVEDVRAILDQHPGIERAHYAIVSGVLVHGPAFSHYFAPMHIEVIKQHGKPKDVLHELRRARREDYTPEMLRYLSSKSENANLLCVGCSEPLSTATAREKADLMAKTQAALAAATEVTSMANPAPTGLASPVASHPGSPGAGAGAPARAPAGAPAATSRSSTEAARAARVSRDSSEQDLIDSTRIHSPITVQEGGDAPDLSGHGGSKFAGMFRTSTRTSARSKQASKCLLM